MMKKGWSIFCLSLLCAGLNAQQPIMSSGDIYHGLQQLSNVGRVLYIAAHPDDENTRVISWLEKERHVQTAYLSLTRGDGGQNLIGTEKGELLGVLRTRELLNARAIDGGQQFFTRAVDFGYSKSPEETLNHWDEQAILYDMVWVIRRFRPHAIITRFPPDSQAGHGHHSASAMLAEKAYDMAGDANAFPEQLKYVAAWQPQRLAWNSYTWRRDPKLVEQDVKIALGQFNPVSGRNTGELASLARSQHRCQGFGRSLQRGAFFEYFKPLKGKPFEEDVLEGLDMGWNSIYGAAAVEVLTRSAIGNFDFTRPHQILPTLLQVRQTLLDVLPEGAPVREEKLREVEKLIVACAGIYFDVYTSRESVIPGDSLPIQFDMINRSPYPVTVRSVQLGDRLQPLNRALTSNQLEKYTLDYVLPENQPLSSPYWLKVPGDGDMYSMPEPENLGMAVDDPALVARVQMVIQGEVLTLSWPVWHKRVEPDRGEVYQPVTVAPPVFFEIPSRLELQTGSGEMVVSIAVEAAKPLTGHLVVEGENCEVLSESRLPLDMARGEKRPVTVRVLPSGAGLAQVHFSFQTPLATYDQMREVVNYEHIPKTTIFRHAAITIRSMDLRIPDTRVLCIEGAGDDVAEFLGKTGLMVEEWSAEQALAGNLADYDVILAGIRLYNVFERMPQLHNRLMAFVKQGGTLITQYQTRNFLSEVNANPGPFPLQISRNRVTEEQAAVKVLQPDHPAFNYPHKLGDADWDGWVQERGLYFADEWSDEYVPLLQMHDTGEEPLYGSLVYAPYGKGHFYYAGISFFRQLPAGVEGAYKLLLNLIATPKHG